MCGLVLSLALLFVVFVWLQNVLRIYLLVQKSYKPAKSIHCPWHFLHT